MKAEPEKVGRVFFVSHPMSIDDLRKPHLYEQERPYRIVKAIKLQKIDYENFTTDYNGKESRFERRDVLGIVSEDLMPGWVKDRLNLAEKQRKRDRDAR